MLLTFVYNCSYRCKCSLRIRERTAFLYLAPGISGICASQDFFLTGEQEDFFFGLALFFSLFASLKLGNKGQKSLAFATFYRAIRPDDFLRRER